MKYMLAALIILVIALTVRLLLIRRSITEISERFGETLREDSNSLLQVSSSDRSIEQLASVLNGEAAYLRKEYLGIENRNTELQNAITNVAHDLRTPITAISGYAELLEREDISEKALEYTGIIRERTETLKSLTEELFQYSVIDNTSGNLDMEEVVLNHELETAVLASYQLISDKGIKPEIRIPETKVVCVLDRKALARVFGNILNNAAKYSDGDLVITLNEEGKMTFTNSASSLSEIEVGKLFDRFFTVENARGSTGLGLSIARLLTEKMGGSVYAEYENGRFSVSLCFDTIK